jgi:hypothetical protein
MPVNPQAHPFGNQFAQYERSWDNDLSAALEVMQGGAGIMSGARLNIPTTGDLLRPVGTDGWLVSGDKIYGPNLSDLTDTAPINVAMRRILNGPKPYYYAPAANTYQPREVILGEISTSATAIKAIGQSLNPSGGLYGLRGVVNLAACDKGADVALANWLRPIIHGADIFNASLIQVVSATARILTAAVAGTDVNFKIGTLTNNVLTNPVTVATILAANTGTVGAKAVGTPGLTWVIDPIVGAGANLGLAYNVASGPTAGIAEVTLHFRYL